MIIGIPKEILNEEYRVAATPSIVGQLVDHGHKVLVQANGGLKSGFPDREYIKAGAEILEDPAEIWGRADMIYKVKEPKKAEYKYFREGLIIFCYLHIAANKELLDQMLESGVVGIAYETIEVDGSLPLLKPMSEIGGCMSIIEGSNLLKSAHGGKGKLIQGMPGVPPSHVVVIGGGTAGRGAIRAAAGIGARVTVIERNIDKMAQLQDIYGPRLETLYSNSANIEKALRSADIVVGAVLLTGERAPKLVTEDMVKGMEKGSVIVDISVDQGGIFETIDRVTSHSDPTYIKHGIVHYAVPNIPGTVPETATTALSNVTSKYTLEIADKGIKKAIEENESLMKGVNIAYGKITHPGVAKSFDKEYTSIEKVI